MKNSTLVITLVTALAGALLFYYLRRGLTDRRLDLIADAGYETAQDILFPLKSQKARRR